MKTLRALIAVVCVLSLWPAAAGAKPRYSWTGLYGGALLAGDWSATSRSSADVFRSDFALPSGFAAGGLLGLNLTSGALVLGVESDLALPDLTHSSCATWSLCTPDFGREFTGSVRGRAGFTLGRALIYGTGGYAFSNLSDYSLGTRDASPTVFRNGWTVGGGVEYALGDHTRAGLEYRSNFYDGGPRLPGTAFQPQGNEISFRLTFH